MGQLIRPITRPPNRPAVAVLVVAISGLALSLGLCPMQLRGLHLALARGTLLGSTKLLRFARRKTMSFGGAVQVRRQDGLSLGPDQDGSRVAVVLGLVAGGPVDPDGASGVEIA